MVTSEEEFNQTLLWVSFAMLAGNNPAESTVIFARRIARLSSFFSPPDLSALEARVVSPIGLFGGHSHVVMSATRAMQQFGSVAERVLVYDSFPDEIRIHGGNFIDKEHLKAIGSLVSPAHTPKGNYYDGRTGTKGRKGKAKYERNSGKNLRSRPYFKQK